MVSEAFLESVMGSLATVGVAGTTGWFALRQSRSAAKVTPYEILERRIVSLEASDEKKTEEIHKLNIRLDMQDRRLRAWDNFYSDLAISWEIHRARDAPPPRPHEEHYTKEIDD